jgi:hypothetical protein
MSSWTCAVRFIAAEDSKEYLGQPCDADVDIGLATANKDQVTVHVIEGSL